MSSALIPADLAGLDVCYLTTTGRVTGRPHRIEIWFAHHEGTLYFLAGDGERADWVRNLLRDPQVRVRVGPRSYEGVGRVVGDPREKRRARDLVYRKYAEGYDGDLTEWRRTALPVAVDLAGRPGRVES